MLVSFTATYANCIVHCPQLSRETGALCAMKEVEVFPDDPKSAECIKQLQQVIIHFLVCSLFLMWFFFISVEIICRESYSFFCPLGNQSA